MSERQIERGRKPGAGMHPELTTRPGLPSRARLGVAVLAAVGVLAVAGCGGNDGDGDPQTGAAVSQPGPTQTQAKGPVPGTGSPASVKPTPAADRADVVRTGLIDGTGTGKNKNKFHVKTVRVSDGRVDIKTGGYSQAEEAAVGKGACAWVAGAETWMTAVKVTGASGKVLATWAKGDKSCGAAGSGS